MDRTEPGVSRRLQFDVVRIRPPRHLRLIACLVAFPLAIALSKPDDALPERQVLPGLVAEYDDGKCRVVEVVDTIGISLAPDESIHPALRSKFEAIWSGFLNVFEAGEYRFDAGPARVMIDGKVVRADRSVPLVAGRHPFRVTYQRGAGPASLELRWWSDTFVSEPIPGTVFSHRGGDAELVDAASVDRGRTLVKEYGCVHCHAASSETVAPRNAPPLDGAGARLKPAWIHKWLEAPTHFRADAAMPEIALLSNPSKRRDVTAYLTGLKGARKSSSREPLTEEDVARGQDLFQKIGCRACHGEKSGTLAGIGSKWTSGALIDYLKDPASVSPKGRMPSFFLTDDEAVSLAAYLLQSRVPTFEEQIPDWDQANSKNGEEIVRASGCLGCHELGGQRYPQRAARPPGLTSMSTRAGCLADSPPADVPRYRLSAGDVQALRDFLDFFKKFPDRSTASTFSARRKLTELHCTSCHALGNRTPSLPLVSRVPTLSGIGGKLTTEWIAAVLEKKKRIRPYLQVRMPHFVPALIEGLSETLSRMEGVDDGLAADRPPSAPEDGTPGLVAAGVALLGADVEEGGLSCITCHDFLDHRPIADEKGPQMISITERLRFDWFRRWILNPGRITSGTAMPQYFSFDQRAAAETAISQLWAALSLGEKIPRPAGIGSETVLRLSEALPAPTDTALVVRFLMPGATSAAIAVGLLPAARTPAVSYCFDAATCHVRYAWSGGFIDLGESIGKVSKPPKILGDIYHHVGSFPLRIGTIDRIPDRRFLGYRLVDGSPRFHYEVDGTRVHERVVAAGGGTGHVHEFLIERVTEPMWLVVDSDKKNDVKLTSTIGEFQGLRLTIPKGDNVRFDVRVLMGEEP